MKLWMLVALLLSALFGMPFGVPLAAADPAGSDAMLRVTATNEEGTAQFVVTWAELPKPSGSGFVLSEPLELCDGDTLIATVENLNVGFGGSIYFKAVGGDSDTEFYVEMAERQIEEIAPEAVQSEHWAQATLWATSGTGAFLATSGTPGYGIGRALYTWDLCSAAHFGTLSISQGSGWVTAASGTTPYYLAPVKGTRIEIPALVSANDTFEIWVSQHIHGTVPTGDWVTLPNQ